MLEKVHCESKKFPRRKVASYKGKLSSVSPPLFDAASIASRLKQKQKQKEKQMQRQMQMQMQKKKKKKKKNNNKHKHNRSTELYHFINSIW